MIASTILQQQSSSSSSSHPSSLSEPTELRALSVCLCALAAEGQESPQELDPAPGPGMGQWSPLLRCDLDDGDRDLLAAYGSDEDGYGFDSSEALSGSIGREIAAATVLRGRSSAVNSSDSSDFEERLAREREGGAAQDQGLDAEEQRSGRRVVFVHDVPVYL